MGKCPIQAKPTSTEWHINIHYKNKHMQRIKMKIRREQVGICQHALRKEVIETEFEDGEKGSKTERKNKMAFLKLAQIKQDILSIKHLDNATNFN